VQAVQGTLDGSRPDTSDAIFTIRRMASVRPNMESVSVVSVIALRARLDREAPEPSVAARVAHRVSVALVQHVAAKCFPALVRLPKLMVGSQRCNSLFASRGRCGNASALFLIATVRKMSRRAARLTARSPCASEGPHRIHAARAVLFSHLPNTQAGTDTTVSAAIVVAVCEDGSSFFIFISSARQCRSDSPVETVLSSLERKIAADKVVSSFLLALFRRYQAARLMPNSPHGLVADRDSDCGRIPAARRACVPWLIGPGVCASPCGRASSRRCCQSSGCRAFPAARKSAPGIEPDCRLTSTCE
jgi:hypothetical protein